MTQELEVAKVSVAHMLTSYLPVTETFIYDYLKATQDTHSIVIAELVHNLDQFPLPDTCTLELNPPERFSKGWLSNVLKRRLLGWDRHLDSIIKRHQVDVIHAHFGPNGCAILPAAKRARRPLLTSFYGFDASIQTTVQQFKDRYKDLFEYGSGFLVEGPAMGEKLVALGCPEDKIHIQRIAIHVNQYPIRTEIPDTSTITLVQCGRMIPKKGFKTTLKAFALAKEQEPRLKLNLIGDGPLRPDLEAIAKELNIYSSVRFIGTCTREEFIKELKNAYAFVQPSRRAKNGDSEGGAPTTILEAQACGVPVLATTHDDIPFVTSPDRSALLSEPDDENSLAQNILRLIEDPIHSLEMGYMGRAFVDKHHDLPKLSKELEAFYRKFV